MPGLPERLLRFIQLEMAMNDRRRRQSPAALALVKRARELVEARKAEVTERAVAMQEFHTNYAEIVDALQSPTMLLAVLDTNVVLAGK